MLPYSSPTYLMVSVLQHSEPWILECLVPIQNHYISSSVGNHAVEVPSGKPSKEVLQRARWDWWGSMGGSWEEWRPAVEGDDTNTESDEPPKDSIPEELLLLVEVRLKTNQNLTASYSSFSLLLFSTPWVFVCEIIFPSLVSVRIATRRLKKITALPDLVLTDLPLLL